MNTFYCHFFHNYLFHFFLGSSTENLHQFWGKHKLRHFSATRHRTAYLWRQIREIGAENKNIARFQWCRAFTFPILLQGQFSEKDVEEEQDFVKKCLPSPSALEFVWFLSPCPLEEVFVTEVAISLSFTVYGAISLFPRKQSSPDLQHPPWQTTF